MSWVTYKVMVVEMNWSSGGIKGAGSGGEWHVDFSMSVSLHHSIRRALSKKQCSVCEMANLLYNE